LQIAFDALLDSISFSEKNRSGAKTPETPQIISSIVSRKAAMTQWRS